MEITINGIDELMKAINRLADAFAALPTTNQIAPVAEEAEVVEAAKVVEELPDNHPAVKLEDVRKRLAALANDGKQDTIKDLLAVFNAKKLSDLKQDDYGRLMTLLDEEEVA